MSQILLNEREVEEIVRDAYALGKLHAYQFVYANITDLLDTWEERGMHRDGIPFSVLRILAEAFIGGVEEDV